jgi:hypothetical protein
MNGTYGGFDFIQLCRTHHDIEHDQWMWRVYETGTKTWVADIIEIRLAVFGWSEIIISVHLPNGGVLYPKSRQDLLDILGGGLGDR